MSVRAKVRIEANLSGSTVKDQLADIEAGLVGFDSVTPAWDKIVGKVGDFDATLDVDGDMNDTADAAHDGLVGIEFTFNSTTVMRGRMNADAVNQHLGVFSFYWNKNTVNLQAGANFYAQTVYDGDDVPVVRMRYFPTGYFDCQILLDGGTWSASQSTGIIGSGWHKITLFWKHAWNPGDNDGFLHVLVDDDLKSSITGLNNDTYDWDYVLVGMLYTGSTWQSGSYFMDTFLLDPVGAPYGDKLAALNGAYGMAIPIMNTASRYVSLTDPTAETAITAECRIDPNSIAMGDYESFRIKDFGATLRVLLEYTIASGYTLELTVTKDAGTSSTSKHLITDAPHTIRIIWVASSGADDGYVKLYIDDVLKETLSGLDNDTTSVGVINFGAISGIDAGTYGIFYMDDCRWGPWVDLTSDVIEDITGYWGMVDNGPLDLLADTGAMNLVFKNASNKYSPGHADALVGFGKGTPIRLKITYSGEQYVRFYGKIGNLEIESGTFGGERVFVEVLDWMDYAATHPLVNQGIELDFTGDEVLTKMLAGMPINPLATDFDTGVNEFPTTFDNIGTKTKAYTEMSKVAFSELGPIYLTKDPVYGETLVFENAEARNGLRTPDYVANNNMVRLEVESGENVVNRFVNYVYPRRVDEAPVVLFSLAARQIIGSGQTIVFRGNYTDPDGGGTEVSGFNMIEPEGGDYDMFPNQDGSGVEITGDLDVDIARGTEGTTFTLTNNNAAVGWAWVQIRGYGIYTYNPIEQAAEDSDSINKYGYQPLTLHQKYKQVLTRGSLKGAAVLEQEKHPHTKLKKAHFVANRTDALMLAWLVRDAGDMIHIKETKSGMDKYAYIQGIEFTISPGGLMKFAWILLVTASLLSSCLSPISVEFDALARDGINFGSLPQITKHAALNRSYSAWIYVHSDTPGIVSIIMASFADNAGMTVTVTDSRKISLYQKGVGDAGQWTSPVNSITLNTLHHVLVTRDASDAANEPIIYVDGLSLLVTESNPQGGATGSEEGISFFIGNVKTATLDWARPFDGVIKDVRVYNVILTQDEATLLAAGEEVTRGMVFQGPCVRTKELDYFEDRTLTSADKMIDNMYGCVGTPHDSVITRIP